MDTISLGLLAQSQHQSPSGHNALSLLQVPSVGCSGRSYTCPHPLLSAVFIKKSDCKKGCPVLPSRTTGWRDDLGSNRFCRWCAVSSHWHRRHRGRTSVTAGKHKGGVWAHRVTGVTAPQGSDLQSFVHAHRGFPECSRMAARCHRVTATSVCLAQMWVAEVWWLWCTELLPEAHPQPPSSVSAVLCMSWTGLIIGKKHLISSPEQGSWVCTFP